jgi:hypothetical protein
LGITICRKQKHRDCDSLHLILSISNPIHTALIPEMPPLRCVDVLAEIVFRLSPRSPPFKSNFPDSGILSDGVNRRIVSFFSQYIDLLHLQLTRRLLYSP